MLYLICIIKLFDNFINAAIIERAKGKPMKRIVNIAKNFDEAEKWDIEQQISMTPSERLSAAQILKEHIYGKNPPDIRDQNNQ